jgi:hypothetical protein
MIPKIVVNHPIFFETNHPELAIQIKKDNKPNINAINPMKRFKISLLTSNSSGYPGVVRKRIVVIAKRQTTKHIEAKVEVTTMIL